MAGGVRQAPVDGATLKRERPASRRVGSHRPRCRQPEPARGDEDDTSRRRAALGRDSRAPEPVRLRGGCPRSGTTLLQRMLDNHPELAVAHDSHFIPLAIKNESVGVDPQLTPELVTWVTTYRRFHRLQLSEGMSRRPPPARRPTASRSAPCTPPTHGRTGSGWPVRRHPTTSGTSLSCTRCSPQPGSSTSSATDATWRCRSATGRRAARDPAGGPWDEEPVAVCALWWASVRIDWIPRRGAAGMFGIPRGLVRAAGGGPGSHPDGAGRVPLPSRFAGDGGVSRGQDPPTIRPFLEERLAASHVRSPRLAFGDGAERSSPVRASRRRRAQRSAMSCPETP